jgi:hypothetical protein
MQDRDIGVLIRQTGNPLNWIKETPIHGALKE